MPVDLPPTEPEMVASMATPPCSEQISLRFVPGKCVSDNCRLLALHNVSDQSCKILASPTLVFRDRNGKALPIVRFNMFVPHYGGASLGHGGVIRDVIIPAGRTATVSIAWDRTGRVCFDTQSLTLNSDPPASIDAIDQTGLLMPARVCGNTTDYLDFQQGALELQP